MTLGQTSVTEASLSFHRRLSGTNPVAKPGLWKRNGLPRPQWSLRTAVGLSTCRFPTRPLVRPGLRECDVISTRWPSRLVGERLDDCAERVSALLEVLELVVARARGAQEHAVARLRQARRMVNGPFEG